MTAIWQKLSLLVTHSVFASILININSLAAQAVGLTVEATITADDHYGLFLGNVSGSKLTSIGRNEKGFFDIPDTDPPVPDETCTAEQGPFPWACPEAFSVNIATGVQSPVALYAVVWDDDAVDSALLGEFNLTGCDCDGNELFSIALLTDPSWEYFYSDITNPGAFGDVPSKSAISTEIAAANLNSEWLPAVSRGFNDGTTLPWKQIPAINPSAEFLDAFAFGNENVYIFRKTIDIVDIPPCVPEPSLIFGLATILGLGLSSSSQWKMRKFR